ncbi:rap guanine nucleotide exchange factor 1 isoform X1 [Oncorhynchus mykiss]|uniref:rap guanine nucleotide exchange factor 1 isoform X1 n=1 Tax=Oncorhynchus mykiss TaxID=8022 RepID=UPI00187886C6|nr:rap guanine nucleotide exchange factor 1 isoform X1 [Oncorhynchus mykiss]
MSGKIESKQDSQRSHLSSFTMKLMDKFHSPKIKRTPSKKVSKPPLEHSVKTAEKPANKGLSRLEEHEKDVVSALRYFKTIIDKMAVDKKVLEMLPGSASKVLEAILPLVQVEPRIQHSSAVSSCLNRVYQSLGNLIRWSDQVMLEGVNLEDKETIVTVTTVIKAVLDGVKELVKLTIEKQEHPSPTSPVKPVPPAALTESAAEPPAKEKESLDKSSATTQSTEVLTEPTEEEAEEVAPPKPPLPGVKIAEHNPPALPPKKRQSAPSPTRVAVVAPMSHATSGSGLPMGTGLHKQEYEVDSLQRRFSGGSHSYGGESPRLSPCNSMGKLSKSDEQLSWTVDSGQCSRNTSCETLDTTDHYDPDYDFLHQDLSSLEQMPPLPVGGCLSPLPESHSESSSPSPCPGPGPPLAQPHFTPAYPSPQPSLQGSSTSPLYSRMTPALPPPALPEKKRRSGASSGISDGSYSGSSWRVSFERHPSQYDNLMEEDMPPVPPFPLFTPGVSPMTLCHSADGFVSEFCASETADVPQSPPPLPEKKSRHILKYMQFVEDYSEPQPSLFYQTPQSESIYEQRNKRFQEVYSFNDSYSSNDSVHEPLPPPALPPKQRQLASHSASPSSSSSSSLSCHLQQSQAAVVEEVGSALSMSVSNSFLSRQSSLTTPMHKTILRSYSQDFAPLCLSSIPYLLSSVSSHSPIVHQSQSMDLAAPGTGGPDPVLVANGSLDSSGGSLAVCLPTDSSFSDTRQTSLSESANEEVGEGEYVNLYSSSQAKGDGPLSRRDSSAIDDSLEDTASENPLCEDTCNDSRRQKSSEEGPSSEETDELSLIDHMEIMSRITLKQESDDGPDVRAGSGDILLVHATETDRKDLVLYCEAFLTTYRTFITPEDLIKKLHYRYTRFSHSPDTFKKRVSKNTFFVLVRVVDELCLVEMTEDILKQLMDLVFRLVCNGELSLARVLRKNILDKVEQRKLLRYTNSLKPLAARGVAARPGTLHDFRSHEIADQLTLLDAELFYKIEIPEVLLWAKEQNEEKSPNLTQFTEHFNNMSYWVRSIIILQEKAQDREKLLLKFIKIMKHLRKLNNFNSYLAILSALDSAPIRRLEWQKTTSEGLEEYCTLIDSSSSFRAYRAALADVEPPCIPYLGLILQDLTFVHLGNPDLINGKVNFSKRWQQFNILDSMRRFQQVHYDLKHNDDIVSFFNDFSDHLAEEALWELSLKIKPRNITRRKTEREEKT